MGTFAMTYTHILVPTDGSDRSRRALHEALQLAQTLGSRLTLLHVMAPAPIPVVGMGDQLDARTLEALMALAHTESDRILTEGLAQARQAGVEAQREQVSGDLPHGAIVAAAMRLSCDLIVMASHGRRGVAGLLLGSETQRVLVQAPCSVLVVR
jgi:nucleotide-binding universal stress UspA family protein